MKFVLLLFVSIFFSFDVSSRLCFVIEALLGSPLVFLVCMLESKRTL